MRLGLRTAKSTRLTSSLAILGLIGTSAVLVLFLNASTLANPMLPFQNTPPNAVPGPTGTLVVQVHTNQDENDMLSNPTSQPVFAIGEKAMTVTVADNSSSPQILITHTLVGVLQNRAPGRYVLRLADQTLNIKVPVQIFVGNETKVKITVQGTAYPLLYSEESGVLLKGGKAQSNMIVELR